MRELVVQASWILIVTFAISILYELYRAIFKSHVSKYDAKRVFLTQALPMYVVLFILAILLRMGWSWVVWLVLVLTITLIGVSIFYYNPVIMFARKPGMVDWFEDMVYTGLLFVATALLIYHVSGVSLVP